MKLDRIISDGKVAVAIVGIGYVGLPNALLFARRGLKVIAADINPRISRLTNKGISHINDPMLKKEVPRIWKTGRLVAMTNIAAATTAADVIIISVPTPAESGLPDMRFVKNSCRQIGRGLDKEKQRLIILESTVYPGACREVLKPILENSSGLTCGKDFFLAHCPERMNPGDKIHTIDRVARVVGGIDKKSAQLAEVLYKRVIQAPIFRCSSIETAELIKLVENTQRDINIAYINEIAQLCEKLSLDVYEVLDAAATKWNFYRVAPGPGVGGHCIPNNPYYILKVARRLGYEPKTILTARQVNDAMPRHVVSLIKDGLAELSRPLRGAKILMLGVAYKPNIDDVRQAPSRAIAAMLRKAGGPLLIHDPHVNAVNMAKVHKRVAKKLAAGLRGADCVVLVTPHNEYKKLRLRWLRRAIGKRAVLVDCHNTFSPEAVARAGLVYRGIGRKLRGAA